MKKWRIIKNQAKKKPSPFRCAILVYYYTSFCVFNFVRNAIWLLKVIIIRIMFHLILINCCIAYEFVSHNVWSSDEKKSSQKYLVIQCWKSFNILSTSRNLVHCTLPVECDKWALVKMHAIESCIGGNAWP